MKGFARLLALLAGIVALAYGPTAAAVACTSAATGSWNVAGTWNAACTIAGGNATDGPGADDTVTIASGHVVTVTAPAAATSITVNNPTVANGITISGASTLTVSGAIIMNRPTNAAASTIAVGAGTLSAGSITINGGTTASRVAQVTVSTGTINVTGSITFLQSAAQARLISTGASTINVGGNLTNGGTLTTGGTGTIVFNGAGAQSIGAYTTYNNVTIANGGGTATLLGTTTIGGALDVNSGTLGIGAFTLTVSGPTSVTSMLNITSATGTKIFAGAVTINPGGTWTNTTEAVTFQGGLTHNGATFIAGTGIQSFTTAAAQSIGGSSALTIPNLTVTTPTVLTNTGSLTVSTAMAGNGSLTNTGTLDLGGTSTVTGFTASASGNTVNYTGTGAQTVRLPTGGNYWHLGFSNAGTKTLPAGAINVQGNLTVNAASIVTGVANDPVLNVTGNFTNAGTYSKGNGTASIGGDFTNNGTFNATAGTVSLNGTAAQAIGGTSTTTFINLTVANTAATVSANTSFNITAAGTLTVNANAVLAPTASVVVNNAAIQGTVTGSGTLQVTALAGYSSQYRFTTNTLANLTVEYIGAAAQTVSAVTYGHLKINNGSGCTLAGGTTTVGGTLTLTSGALAVAGSTLVLNGPAIAGTATNLSTTSSSNLSFGGSSAGIFLPGSVTALNNFTIDNANGITLNSNPVVSGTLTLTNGPVVTGSNILSVTGGTCPGNVVRTGGFVEGNLRLRFPAGAVTCTFHVGSGTAYTPITLTMPAGSAGGTLTGRTTDSEHPGIAASGVDANKDVNRFWSLWAAGDTISTPTFDATFVFVAGDVDLGATPTSFVLARYVGTTWSLPTPVTAGAASISVPGIPGPLLARNDFAVGEVVFVCAVPGDLPAGMTCECDNFNRASVNPSTIFGGNFVLSQSSGTPGWPRIANLGLLQMTNASADMSTSATAPGTFPASGNLISVEFRHYAYRTGGGAGADGVGVTLSDSTIIPVTGAFGGSLGYAQKTLAGGAPADVPGFAGGWIGVGFDEWGNYSNATEGRVGGSGFIAQAIAVRGSGAALAGYPYLSGTGTLAPVLDNTSSATPARGHAYRVQVDARCYQNSFGACAAINPSAGKYAEVRVYRDTSGAGTFGAPLIGFEAYATATGLGATQANVPANWRLSFTGSTGGANNIHEFGALKICAQTITPPAGYRIQVDNLTPSTCGTPGGTPSSPIVKVTALDTNGNPVLTYDKTVTLSAPLSGGGASSAVWSLKTGTGTFTPPNQYKFEPTDSGVAEFYLTNASPQSVTVTVSENGGSISSSLAPPPIVYSGGSFTISNVDALGGDIGGGVVTGRAHAMRVTRSNGCVTDTTYVGARNLDGWYTPAAPDHPVGAFAPQICATNVGGTCLPATGACQMLSIAPPIVDPGSNNMPPLAFALGVANFCLVTNDVGKYSISLRDDSATPVVGSSGTLTARPFAIAVRDVTGNPANNGAGGAIFISAGSNFSATVSAYRWATTGASSFGIGDADGDGLPDPGAAFSQFSANGIVPSYEDSVALEPDASAVANFAPAAPPAAMGSLAGGTVAVTGGTGSQGSLNYSEVGSFTLKATPSAGYLNSGVNLANRVAIFAGPGNARTSWIGRFRPHYFDLSGPVITNRSDVGAGIGCTPASTFTYMGEPMNARFTLTAKSAGGGVTQNYAGAWAKFGNSIASWTNFGVNDSIGLWMMAKDYTFGGSTCKVVFMRASPWDNTFQSCSGATPTTPIDLAGAPRPAISTTPALPSITWLGGVGTFSTHTVLRRADGPDGPYASLYLGVAPQDSDGVTLQGAVLDEDFDNSGSNERKSLGATDTRFGVLKLDNAYGSELLDLRAPMRALYLATPPGQFVTNAQDGCTAIAADNVAFSNLLGGLPSPTVKAIDQIVAGQGTIVLNKPSATGSADMALNLGASAPVDVSCNANHPPSTSANQPWLFGKWCGTTHSRDPNARIRYGTSKSTFIYLRELY